MKITKEAVLENLEEVKKYIQEEENKKEEKVLGIAIKNRWTGNVIFQSTKTTYKDAIIEGGKANLSEADLRNSDLSGSDLSYSDLSNSDLSGSDLRYSDLSYSDLSYSDLSDSDLSDSDLRNSDLRGSNLRGSNLRGSEMQNVKLYGRGGNSKIKRNQLDDFLRALGFIIEN